MDISKHIFSLENELEDQKIIEDKAHKRIIEINKLLKSARILERDAMELLGENGEEKEEVK